LHYSPHNASAAALLLDRAGHSRSSRAKSRDADHPPPHFHVLGREGAAQVRIDTP
jgi:hypothetical protein